MTYDNWKADTANREGSAPDGPDDRDCIQCGTELNPYHHEWTEAASGLEHTPERCKAALAATKEGSK
jgi:hypothetical protein